LDFWITGLLDHWIFGMLDYGRVTHAEWVRGWL
jgi:hypothetical protein